MNNANNIPTTALADLKLAGFKQQKLSSKRENLPQEKAGFTKGNKASPYF